MTWEQNHPPAVFASVKIAKDQTGPLAAEGVPTCDMCGCRMPLADLRPVVKSNGCKMWVCVACNPFGFSPNPS